MLDGLARTHPADRFAFCYRPHRFLRSFGERLPANAGRFLLGETRAPRSADVFHGLNQRLPHARLHRAVTTFHDLFVLTGEYSTPEFRRRFAEQARDAAGRSDRIIAVSQFTAPLGGRRAGGGAGGAPQRPPSRVLHNPGPGGYALWGAGPGRGWGGSPRGAAPAHRPPAV